MKSQNRICQLLLTSMILLSSDLCAQDPPGQDDTKSQDATSEISDAERAATSSFEDAEARVSSAFQATQDDIGKKFSETQEAENGGLSDGSSSGHSSSHTEVETRSSTSTITFGPAKNDRQTATVLQARDNIAGRWRLIEGSDSICNIELRTNTWFGGFSAYTHAGCPKEFFSVNRWVLSGDQLQLTDTNDHVIGRFWPMNNGNWIGRRESDGSEIYLNR